MASSCNRFIHRSSLSSIRSAIRSNAAKSPTTRSTTSPFALPTSPSLSPIRRFSLSRYTTIVAVAAAQRGGSGKDDFMPEHNIEELPSTFTGHIRNRLGFAGPVNYAHCIIIKSKEFAAFGLGLTVGACFTTDSATAIASKKQRERNRQRILWKPASKV